MRDHRLIDERSLAFDRLTATKLAENPALLDRARASLRRWLATASPRVRPVLLEWQQLLDGPSAELMAVLAGTDERATRLRQSSPFAGLLSVAERTAIIREFQRRESTAA
ncbi:hypothetical protein BH20VER1_BH20VER1_00550 [soil metagenome]